MINAEQHHTHIAHDESELRKRAIKSIRDKKAFQIHLTIYIVFCLVFVFVDWFDKTPNTLQWAWWPILGWGAGVFFNGYSVYKLKNNGITETEIAEEMQRLQ